MPRLYIQFKLRTWRWYLIFEYKGEVLVLGQHKSKGDAYSQLVQVRQELFNRHRVWLGGN